MLSKVAAPIDARMIEAQRWKVLDLEHHEQALPTQQLANPAIAGTSAVADVAFHQTHVKGDRETALTSNGCVEVLW
jgi:hypothetical protein